MPSEVRQYKATVLVRPIGSEYQIMIPVNGILYLPLWVTHFDGYHLLGLKFDRPLSTDEAVLSGRRLRKAHAAV